MKPIEIVDYDDERLQIPFPSVRVKDGETGPFTLPRYDAIDPDTYIEMLARLREIEEDTEAEPHVKRRLGPLSMLRLFVTDQQYETLQRAKLVQLDHIQQQWAQHSGISLGELLASSPTSMESTGAPSSTTS